MASVTFTLLLLLCCCCFYTLQFAEAANNNVTYDKRSLIINGERKLLISGAIHYPRSVPAMWPVLVKAAKEGGVDVIETYVFWNEHEPSPGNYYFGGRYDLVKFVKIVQDAGLLLILRIGPYICSEWKFGGIPFWLHYVPVTIFRTDSEPFKYYMQNFTTLIVNMMKKEKLFASQGGPIILSQVENEYNEGDYGNGGKVYAHWAAKMAVSQNTGVPWIMCQQWDVPDQIINTCNGFYCDDFNPIYPTMPKIWTENWTGWCKYYGGRIPHRPVEDIAFSVARFFQKGGTVNNYYMYHGGTNFGRTSGGPFITTSYDYDAPIDEYGLPRFPKWGHLKELHRAIKLCENALLNNEPTLIHLGSQQEVDVYEDQLGNCAAFIANMDDKNEKTVQFRNASYTLPPWSVSILPDCKNVVFNTAKVGSQTSTIEMIPEQLKTGSWEIFVEKTGIRGDPDFIRNGFVDHIDTTKDTTDYLWHITRLHVDENEELLKDGNKPTLLIQSNSHALHVFVNGVLQDNAAGESSVSPFNFESQVFLKAGEYEIAILSMTVGHAHAGPFYEWAGAGLTSVKLKGLPNGTLDLSNNKWTYKIGLEGEHLGLYNSDASNWTSISKPPKNQPLTWYKAIVDAPSGDEPVALDMIHMGKGFAWLNGEQIGRYWTTRIAPTDKCVSKCDYRGKFNLDKCHTGCGQPTQRWYHVPRSWFKPSGNVLVIFEEIGGDPTQIKFSRRKVSALCGHVYENHPSFVTNELHENKPSLELKCPINTHISSFKFASFGTPNGTCQSYAIGNCHDPDSMSVVEKLCLNKNECVIELTKENFKTELCPGKTKKLVVEAMCS